LKSNEQEVEVSAAVQDVLTDLDFSFNSQKSTPDPAATGGPIRKSPRLAMKKNSRSSPYDKSLKVSLSFKFTKPKANSIKTPEAQLGSSDTPPVQSHERTTHAGIAVEGKSLPPPERIEPVEPDSLPNALIEVANVDDSGYASDDGLEQAFADAAEYIEAERAKIERERQRYPWRPRVSSPLKNEVHPDEKTASTDVPVLPKSPRLDRLPLDYEQEEKLWNRIDLISELAQRDIHYVKNIQNYHCNRSDHHARIDCRCRSTGSARAVLQIGHGHLTPQRIRKATHQQLRLISRLGDCYSMEKTIASAGVMNAYVTLVGLKYGVKWLQQGTPGLADLQTYPKEIYKRYKNEYADRMLNEHGYETKEERRAREKRELLLNKGQHVPPKRIVKARQPTRSQRQKNSLPKPRPGGSRWHQSAREERAHAWRAVERCWGGQRA
jgi:hypothetical protein